MPGSATCSICTVNHLVSVVRDVCALLTFQTYEKNKLRLLKPILELHFFFFFYFTPWTDCLYDLYDLYDIFPTTVHDLDISMQIDYLSV